MLPLSYVPNWPIVLNCTPPRQTGATFAGYQGAPPRRSGGLIPSQMSEGHAERKPTREREASKRMSHRKEEFVIGVDPHPATHTACVLDQTGKVVAP